MAMTMMMGVTGHLRYLLSTAYRLLPYWWKVVRRLPIEDQVSALPRRIVVDVKWIKLASITLATDVREWRLAGSGFALLGDWDRHFVERRPSVFEPATDSTAKSITHGTMRALFIDGCHYRQTTQYEVMRQAVDDRRPELAYGCHSLDDVDRYFGALIEAYQTMRDRGFLTQHELHRPPGDEIKVYLTRDGQFCHGNGGNHRIRLAELLGIEWVPVVVAGAHAEWLYTISQRYDRPPRAALLQWLSDRQMTGAICRERPAAD